MTKTTTIKGKGILFGITKEGQLINIVVDKERVSSKNKNCVLPGLKASGPLYMECQNYFVFPKQLKGTLVAFKQSKEKDVWKLGIIEKMHRDTQVLDLFVWNGPIVDLQVDTEELSSFYPSFYLEDLSTLNEKVTEDLKQIENWRFHFSTLRLGMDKFTDFRYLNQVDGLLPKISLEIDNLVPQRIHASDGCYNQAKGPDVWMVFKGSYYKKIKTSNNPFFDSSPEFLSLPNNLDKEKAVRKNTMMNVPAFFKTDNYVDDDPKLIQCINVKNTADRCKTLPQRKNCFYCPFPSDFYKYTGHFESFQSFAVISSDHFFRLKEWEGLTIEEFELRLFTYAEEIVTLPVFHDASKGLVFVILPEEVDDGPIRAQTSTTEEIIVSDGGMIPFIPHLIEGSMVSSWISDIKAHPGRVTEHFIELTQLCV